MLLASGQLNLKPPDGSLIQHRDILVNLAGNLHEPCNHRSVYLCYLRSSPPPELAVFDLPEFTSVVGRREVSTVPNQALHLYNSPFVIQQAEHLAEFVMTTSKDTETRVTTLWQRTLGRTPEEDEALDTTKLLHEAGAEDLSETEVWTSLCQALLLTNEFRYVD